MASLLRVVRATNAKGGRRKLWRKLLLNAVKGSEKLLVVLVCLIQRMVLVCRLVGRGSCDWLEGQNVKQIRYILGGKHRLRETAGFILSIGIYSQI